MIDLKNHSKIVPRGKTKIVSDSQQHEVKNRGEEVWEN
jgi:hypothetical protein